MVLRRCDAHRWLSRRAAWAVGLTAILLCASAPGGKPSAHRSPSGPERHPGAEYNKHRVQSPAAPFVLNISFSRDEAPPTSEKKHDDDGGQKWTDIVIALAAAGSLLFTYALWRSTDKLWAETKRLAKIGEQQHNVLLESVAEAKRSGDIAQKVADATRISVDIAQQALRNDRAWIWVKLISCSDIKPEGNNLNRWFLEVNLELQNLGRSAAIIISAKSSVYWIQGLNSAEPDPALFSNNKFKSVTDHGLNIRGWGMLATDASRQRGMGKSDFMIAEGETKSGICERFTFNRVWSGQRGDDSYQKYFVYIVVRYTDIRGVECETSVYKYFFVPNSTGELSSSNLRQRYNYRK